MILGHGVDLESLQSIKEAYERNHRFAKRILTKKEYAQFEALSGKRQIEYLAGRWSAKEAFAKAWGTGIGQVRFQDLEIMHDEKGAPVFTKSPFEQGNVWVSLSHTDEMVMASVLLEKRDESK